MGKALGGAGRYSTMRLGWGGFGHSALNVQAPLTEEQKEQRELEEACQGQLWEPGQVRGSCGKLGTRG